MDRSTSRREPSWLADAVFYQIYPQSFRDANGDGIGDLAGIIEKLDYIESLGVRALWLNPCFVSPFKDAGYDVSDFYHVAPRYGTDDDMVRLFDEAHRRGLKVCLDLVAGHTSSEHPWFKASARADPNEFSDWFVWTRSMNDTGKDAGLAGVNGMGDRDGCAIINFFSFQPALNYGFARPDPRFPWQQSIDAPGPRAVRAELKNIMRHWLERGADGFRVDMASSLIKNDPDKAATAKLWAEFRGWFDAEWPEAVLISEWFRPAESLNNAFHIDFSSRWSRPFANYREWMDGGGPRETPPFFDAEGRGDIREFLDVYEKELADTRAMGYISIPSGNHDTQRPSNGRSMADQYALFAFFLTMPGVPILFNGDEIGMRYIEGLTSKEGGYARTGGRTPVQWDDTRNAGFSTAPADDLYLPLDPAPDRPTVAAQDADPSSLLNHIRELARLRRETPALHAGGLYKTLHGEARSYPYVYSRGEGAGRVVVALNPRAEAATAEFAESAAGAKALYASDGAKLESSAPARARVTLPGRAFGLWRLDS